MCTDIKEYFAFLLDLHICGINDNVWTFFVVNIWWLLLSLTNCRPDHLLMYFSEFFEACWVLSYDSKLM